MECNIVGGGPSKTLVKPDRFTISTNFHCSWANLIFAVDEPIVESLLRKNVDGFTHQLIFTNPKVYPRYKDYHRCFEFNYKNWVKSHSLSSGMSAIVLAHALGFQKIHIYGFEKVLENHRENKLKFDMIRDNSREYIFYDS